MNLFLDNLDKNKYYTGYDRIGNSNYAFTLLLRNDNLEFRNKIEYTLKENGIEFRRGMSGGGNQLRQPYLKNLNIDNPENYPHTEHVHNYGWYIGNYPRLEKEKIYSLTALLNNIQYS